jgi:beta-glucosidase
VTYLNEKHHMADSDEGAITLAIKAGIDVICNEKPVADKLLVAMNTGLLTPKELDNALIQNMTARFRLGLFDPPENVPFTKIPSTVVGNKAHKQLALQSARESIVLLQNDPVPPGYGFEKILPLDLRRVHSIAVLGPYADALQYGDYSGAPANAPVSVLDGLRAAVGNRVQLVTADWGDDTEGAKAAAQCDVAIVVVGLDAHLENESIDRQTLELPTAQRRFLRKVILANPVTIVVVEAGSPIAMSWIKEHVPASLMLWYPGEQGGNALADVLLGRYNPSGRLPVTFYASLDDLPAQDDYEIADGRTYMYHTKTAPFVFGHGLSYATFAYSNLHVDPPADGGAGGRGTVSVHVDVTNQSTRDGDEVVQLYVHKGTSAVSRPIKQLAAFQRLTIPAGQTRTIPLTVRLSDIAYWDVASHQFIVEKGTYDVLVGASSALSDLPAHGTFDVK